MRDLRAAAERDLGWHDEREERRRRSGRFHRIGDGRDKEVRGGRFVTLPVIDLRARCGRRGWPVSVEVHVARAAVMVNGGVVRVVIVGMHVRQRRGQRRQLHGHDEHGSRCPANHILIVSDP